MAKKAKFEKRRKEAIYATTRHEVSRLGIEIDTRSGDMRFLDEMDDTYIERSYERPKKPKILSRVPQKTDFLSFNSDKALVQNYDEILAVDTNRLTLQGSIISIVGIAPIQLVWIPEAGGLKRYYKFRIPFCLEYHGLKVDPEKFGWISAFEHFVEENKVAKNARIGMIVDHDLGQLNNYNAREIPLFDGVFLPKNLTLIYASSDAGSEAMANQIIRVADSVAKQCFSALRSGALPYINEARPSKWYDKFRIVSGAN